MHNDLLQRPQEHEARIWIDRIGAQRHAVANRLGIHYSYLCGILSRHFPATHEIEEKLQAIIEECQEIYRRRNGEAKSKK